MKTCVISAALVAIIWLPTAFAEECLGDAKWLYPTKAPDYSKKPLSHGENGGDCPFYEKSWETFLYVSNPDQDGFPNFIYYPTIESTLGLQRGNVFPKFKKGLLSLAPRIAKDGSVNVGAGVDQAATQNGTPGILIDRDGFPVYYGIHMDQVFVDFLVKEKLTTPEGAKNASANLVFPRGSIELKSAWKVLPADFADKDTYFTMQAEVPRLKKDGNNVVIDKASAPQEVTVALVALHVVYVLEGHPEFIWSTFEHVNKDGDHDSAPLRAFGNPAQDAPVDSKDYLFYTANNPYRISNKPPDPARKAALFLQDARPQKFDVTQGAVGIPSSIFRTFPVNKVKGRDANGALIDAREPDVDIETINKSMGEIFKNDKLADAKDKRRFYRLVGAVWLDKPQETFSVNERFRNGSNQTSDEGPVAGEDALSSTAMESFTQDSPTQNCFGCHDTREIKNGVQTVMEPKLINVSHILSKFLIESQ